MIALERTTAPAVLVGPRAEKAYQDAEEFFRADTRAARQRQFPFEQAGLLDHQEVAASLREMTSARCAFCGIVEWEKPFGLGTHHFRPPQEAVAHDGATSRRHYWWLAYQWENLYLACADCRTAQGAKFPTERSRVRVGTKDGLAEKEEPLLLDPCHDDPERYFIYLDSGEVVSNSQRGEATIETFDLNRPFLVQARHQAAEVTRAEIAHTAGLLNEEHHGEFVEAVLNLYSEGAPFAAQRRQLVNQWVQMRPRKVDGILNVITDEELELDSLAGSLRRITNQIKEDVASSFFGPFLEEMMEIRPEEAPAEGAEVAWAPAAALDIAEIHDDRPSFAAAEIRSVEIRNFRAIEQLELEFTKGPGEGSWLMLLGENGTGKTSVLQAIGLALADPQALTDIELDTSRLLRQGADEALVRVTLTGRGRQRELRFGRGVDGLQIGGALDQDVMLAAYGSTRLLPENSGDEFSRSRIASLFDPFFRLTHPHSWLPSLSSEEFDAAAQALRSLLNLEEDQEIWRAKAGLEIVRGKSRLTLSDLSDGNKAMAVFALDMMQLFLERWGSIEAAEGIVLVDELGAHLHPRWQMEVVRSLRETFPRVQFIATTHDPLCLRGLHDGEVVVLRRTRDHIFSLHDELPPVEGLAVDQLLTSEHFGLNSALDPKVESLFASYYDLLAQRDRGAEDERALAILGDQLADLRLLGTTRRERLALEAVDAFLADERNATSAESLADLRESTKQQVKEIWQEVSGT